MNKRIPKYGPPFICPKCGSGAPSVCRCGSNGSRHPHNGVESCSDPFHFDHWRPAPPTQEKEQITGCPRCGAVAAIIVHRSENECGDCGRRWPAPDPKTVSPSPLGRSK